LWHAGRSKFHRHQAFPQQLEWQDLEFGVIIQLRKNTFLDREWGDGTADPKVFNPTDFEPEQWMRAVKAAGRATLCWSRSITTGFCCGRPSRPTTA
jgi:alpha-L-fucosidase